MEIRIDIPSQFVPSAYAGKVEDFVLSLLKEKYEEGQLMEKYRDAEYNAETVKAMQSTGFTKPFADSKQAMDYLLSDEE